MANEAEEARALATRLFARAHRAREQGHLSFAEVLSASAQRSLDTAMALEAALAPVPRTGHQAVVQQQQQIQPDKEEPGNEAKPPDERKP